MFIAVHGYWSFFEVSLHCKSHSIDNIDVVVVVVFIIVVVVVVVVVAAAAAVVVVVVVIGWTVCW